MDLTPARWIWFPSQRTLPNTFVLFRHSFTLQELPTQARGWITADSRYRLTVNGQRVQWGPAPCDPRSLDVDPCDITPFLQPGENVIGVEVLFYGHGDGTWALGKPGLIVNIDLDYTQDRQERIVSSAHWLAYVDRAHRPGQPKRWFLRALQEDFDARIHPQGWQTSAFTVDARWLPAMELDCASDKPPLSGHYKDYLHEAQALASESELRARSIPPMHEELHAPLHLAEAGSVHWQGDPLDWFDFRTPDTFTITRDDSVVTPLAAGWQVPASTDARTATFLTFEWAEEMVGWPSIVVDAPEGTIIELIWQESHDSEKTLWLDSQFFNWTRLTCYEGLNTFEPFDFEAFRWLQLHIRAASRPVQVQSVHLRRRSFPWPHTAEITTSEPALQRLFDASINTLYNSVQETNVDGMARERQQYSGDCGHQLHAVRYAFGETSLPQRFLRTYSMGQTIDGYFLDSWPGHDRLARIAEREVGTTSWGPLLDHSVGFVFDCWHSYLESGDLAGTSEAYPHLVRFLPFLNSLRDRSGLLPVENLGITMVWIDHEAYLQQRHKQCAFNLYAVAMLRAAFAPLAFANQDPEVANNALRISEELLATTIEHFWCRERKTFINNLPWLEDEGQGPRLCDRSLATALLFNLCPDGETERVLAALADCPPELGISYPANANWRYWALARYHRVDLVVSDLRTRWATMESVIHNNTLQEFWSAPTDSTAQWSHCPLAPLLSLYLDIAGIRAVTPGFARYEIRPQLADLSDLSLTAHTPQGPITFVAIAEEGGHTITLTPAPRGEGILIVPEGTQISLQPITSTLLLTEQRFRLLPGQACTFWLPG